MSVEGGSADAAPAEHLHPFFLLTGLGGSLRGVAGGYAGIGYLAATGRLSTAILAGAALLLFLLISLLLYWRRFSYRVGAHEIRIDSGILSRTHRSIPFDRVQDVDISQGPIARLLGLAKVKFETGGSAAAGADDGVLPAIALERAEALREQIRARRGHAAVAQPVAAEGRPLFAMNLRRVLLSGVFGFSLAIFAGLFGATQTIGEVIGFDPLERSFWEDLLMGHPAADYVAQHKVLAGVAGLLLLVVAGFVTGIIRSLLRDYRFRLERTGSGLRRRRGLLTITDVTLPLRRVQAALLLSGPLRDRFGWRELKFQSLARDEDSKGDHVVAPLARDEEITPILQELGWSLPGSRLERLDRAYMWLPLAGLLAVGVILVGLSFLEANTGFGLILVAGVAISRWLDWRRSGFAIENDRLVLRTGWWRRRTGILPLANVQSVDLRENAIGRSFGVASLVIGVAGGSGFSGHRIPALGRERAREIRRDLLSRFP